MNQMISPNSLSASPLSSGRIRFTGDNATFTNMVTRGALLELVTFGFYRFWLNTATRRHLWANTRVAGDAPEYLGRPRELLVGFLFAMAILVPLYIGYFVMQLEASRLSQFANIPLFMIVLGFLQFAEYRARRYRLTRTIWRGVRFSMGGSGVGYALRAFGWQILVVLTLGLAYPWRAAALEHYKMANTSYGDQQGAFEGTGWTFFKRGILVWLAAMALLAVFVGGLLWIASGVGQHPTKLTSAKAALLIADFTLIPLAASFLYPAFQAIQWKWWAEGLRIGGVAVKSDLRIESIVGNTWTMIGVMFGAGLVLAFLGICVAGVIAMAIASSPNLASSLGAMPILKMVSMLVAYVPFILVFGIIRRVYTTQRVWKIVAGSMTLEGLETIDDVLADLRADRPVGALGEGLSEGFELAAF